MPNLNFTGIGRIKTGFCLFNPCNDPFQYMLIMNVIKLQYNFNALTC